MAAVSDFKLSWQPAVLAVLKTSIRFSPLKWHKCILNFYKSTQKGFSESFSVLVFSSHMKMSNII